MNKITSGLLKGLTNLTFLELEDNPIEIIEDNSFIDLQNLETLDISFCSSLTVINENSLKGLTSLKVIDFY